MAHKERDEKTAPVSGNDATDGPRVLRCARVGEAPSRRAILRGAGGAAILGGATALGCSNLGSSELDIRLDPDGNCTCHVVCTCDTDKGGAGSHWSAEYDSEGHCTCDTVCTCNTVCTCDSEGGGGGGGSSYWYPN
jgi:hypothetical protein